MSLTDALNRVLGLVDGATPGEWRIGVDDNHPGNRRIAAAARPHIAKVYASDFGNDSICDANAATIAAAINFLRTFRDELEGVCAERDALREEVAAMVERDDLVYTDELAVLAAQEVGLWDYICTHDIQATALLRGFLSRAGILAKRAKRTDAAIADEEGG